MLLQNTHALGVFEEEGIKKFALVCRMKGSLELLGVGEERLASVEFRKGSAFLGKKRLPLTASLPSKDLLFRRFAMNVKSHHHLMKALPFQLETRLPYPASEAVIAIEHEGKDLLLYATQNTCMEEALSSWKKRGLDPDHLAPVPAALAAFCTRFFPEAPEISFIYLGKQEGCIGSLKEGKCLSTFSFTHLARHLATLPASVPVVLLGSAASSLREAVEQSGRKLLSIDNRLSTYALPIGLACLALTQPVDLRFGRYLSRVNFRRTLLPRLSALLVAATLLLSTALVTHLMLHQSEARLAQELSIALEREVQEDELSSAVDGWESALEGVKNPDLVTLKVSDLFAFLSTHPLFTQHGIDLRRLRYTPGKIDLELVAPAPRVQSLREALAAEKRLVDREKGVQLEQLPDSYLFSFTPPRTRS